MYGPVPPVVAPMFTAPVLEPQEAFVVVVAKAVGPAIFVIVALVVKAQPFASFTMIAYVPGAKLVKEAVEENPPPLNEYR